jgi:uncharacterized protein GlcG (DUF336 family)
MLVVGIALALGFAAAVALLLAGCGGGSAGIAPPPPPPPAFQPLTHSEVTQIVTAAAVSAAADTMVIAVVDRRGQVLGVFRKPNAPALALANFSVMSDSNNVAVQLARTGAFFSNDQAPLTSRTVRFISGLHIPPDVINQPPPDLYGIENTNRGCTLSAELESHGFLPSTAVSGSDRLGIITGKKDVNDSDQLTVNPGGIPIYRGNVLVGGIGVTGVSPDLAEYTAFKGATATGFGDFLFHLPPPGAVFLGGVVLPAIDNTSPPAGAGTGTMTGNWFLNATDATGAPAEGDLVAATAGANGLSASDVSTILNNAEAEAKLTRAAIRLPEGQRARMVIAVADLDGTILGLRRMPDATVFSIDVAASKARNMVYFNSAARLPADLNQVPMSTAVTNRTIGFGAMPLFPPGIDGSSPGPFFNLYTMDVANPCTQGFQSGAPNDKKSGIVFFPGSAGLYKNGVLVGGLGVSGDGVDQDDFVTSAGTAGFEAPTSIRADQIVINGVRLPYFKFPRNPTN